MSAALIINALFVNVCIKNIIVARVHGRMMPFDDIIRLIEAQKNLFFSVRPYISIFCVCIWYIFRLHKRNEKYSIPFL